MEKLDVIILLAGIAFILLAISLVKAVALKKANTLLAQQLTETSNSLELVNRKFATLREKQQKNEEFQNSLTDATLSTRIQKSRTVVQNGHRATPEKYCYIHSLAGKGLSSDEIAAVLTISPHEARQLVTLAKIAQGN